MKPYKKILSLVLITSLLGLSTKVIAKPVEIVPLELVPITFESEIQRIFGDKAEIAFAVFQHESNLKITAKGWNCIYNGRSTFCKVEDRHKAWSVDCGIAQINIRGLTCPPELMTEMGSIPYIERIYNTQGLNAWVSYKTGVYKKYL